MQLGINTHIHLPPNFSAFSSADQAVELARAEGIELLGVSNYYDFQVYRAFRSLCAGAGIEPLFGLEIIYLDRDLQQKGVKVNDPGNPGKVYLCGKGISRWDALTGEARRLMGVIRTGDAARMTRMCELLEDRFQQAGFATGLTASSIIGDLAGRFGVPRETVVLQERHVAEAFQIALFANSGGSLAAVLERVLGAVPSRPEDPLSVQTEIRSHLMKAGRPAYVEEEFVDQSHALQLIEELGGIACYPVLADGARPICEFEADPRELARKLGDWGITAAEVIPIRNTPEVLRDYVLTLRDAGLTITAGTEHNTPDLIPLEPRCLGGAPLPEELIPIFREGAERVAAYQGSGRGLGASNEVSRK